MVGEEADWEERDIGNVTAGTATATAPAAGHVCGASDSGQSGCEATVRRPAEQLQ